LQHLVRRKADARHHVRRPEPGLFDLGEIILRIAVQLDDADPDQRIILVRLDFGQVEGVIGRLVGIGLGHDLDAEPPFRVAPRSIASNRSRWWLSRSSPTVHAASALVRVAMPCIVFRWNFT
jgi:hypothetical protein